MACDRDESIARWIARFAGQTHLDHTTQSVRESRTEKRTFWRASLVPPEAETVTGATSSKVEVAAEEKPDGRSLLAISHTGLPGADAIERWRAYWKTCLGEL